MGATGYIMEPFDAYKYYMAIKLHFESDSYDAPKYNFKTSISPQSFWKRRDKYHFAKLSRKFNNPDDLVEFYISQFVNGNKWVGDMFEGDEYFTEWKRKKESLTYTFTNDINSLTERVKQFDDLFLIDTHPLVVKEYMSNNICLESVVILDKLVGFMKDADKKITETIVWPDVSRLIKKYRTFVNCDLKKMQKICIKGFTF